VVAMPHCEIMTFYCSIKVYSSLNNAIISNCVVCLVFTLTDLIKSHLLISSTNNHENELFCAVHCSRCCAIEFFIIPFNFVKILLHTPMHKTAYFQD
jgi:hypothetical protein